MLNFNKKLVVIFTCIFIFCSSMTVAAGEVWAPYRGYSSVNHSYAYNSFYFNWNAVKSFESKNTYEQESQVYDNKFANYAHYWTSNLPRAYYDTAFCDSLDNFTIGSAAAVVLRPYQQYYTYMALKKEKKDSAIVRIKGQKGKRSPSWCYSTWCIYAEATTGTMAKITAPGSKSWTY